MSYLLNKKSQKTVFIIGLIIVMGIFRGMDKPNGYLFDIEFILNFILNTALLLTWIISIYIRIIHKKTRIYLLSTGMLMFFWLFVRTLKYRVFSVFPNTNFLWYLYYVPIVLIPLLSYYTAQTVGQTDDYQLPRRDKLLLIPAGVIILGVLTNDFHRMAFIFEGNFLAGMTYGYGPFYYVSYLFAFFFVIRSIYIMFQKSRIKESKDRIYLPFIIVFVYILYSIFYNLNQNHKFLQFIEITIAYCMTTIAFWESCIQIGLIRSNSNYNEFFKYSASNTGILDLAGNTCCSTGESIKIDPKMFEQLKKDSMFSPNIKSRFYISEITGGYVLWEEKLDFLLSLIDKLETVNSKIENDIILIQNQMNLDEKRIQLREKNRLYDIINRNTHEQMNKIRENLEYLRRHGDDVLKWQEINIRATYIKRYSNLVFISEYSNGISLEDMRITIKESLNNLKKMGIHEGLKMDSFTQTPEESFEEQSGEMSKEQAFQVYSAIEHVIEHSFCYLKNIYIVIRNLSESLSMSILLNGEGLNHHFAEETWIPKADDSMCCHVEAEDDDNLQISMRFYKR